MEKNSKMKILYQYKDKTLGIREYGDNHHFSANDLINPEILSRFISEVDSMETNITKDGHDFIIEYYGLDVALQILKDHGLNGLSLDDLGELIMPI